MRSTIIVLAIAFANACSAHTVLTYPLWRGNTLDNDMQWQFPCGGIPTTTNRTAYPLQNGAIAFQPGHATGHSTAMLTVNLFLGNNNTGLSGNVENITMVPLFQLVSPNGSNDPYNGTFCFPDVNWDNTGVVAGMNATVQIIELAKNGAALYNCADITFQDIVTDVSSQVCFNTTGIGLQDIFSTKALVSGSPSTRPTLLIFGGLFLVAFSLMFAT